MKYTPFDPTMKFNVKLNRKSTEELSKASASQQLGLPAIESESGNPQNCIISKAVNISHNQSIREGYLKPGTRHLNYYGNPTGPPFLLVSLIT